MGCVPELLHTNFRDGRRFCSNDDATTGSCFEFFPVCDTIRMLGWDIAPWTDDADGKETHRRLLRFLIRFFDKKSSFVLWIFELGDIIRREVGSQDEFFSVEDFQNYFVMREPQPSLTLTYFRSDHSSLGQINYLFKYSSAKWVVRFCVPHTKTWNDNMLNRNLWKMDYAVACTLT